MQKKLDLKRVKAGEKRDQIKVKMKDKKRKKLAKIMGEQFIQEVEEKKDKVDKIVDIMRGKNKVEISPDIKESVKKRKI